MTTPSRGFSLIEVLVTIAILMIGLLGLAALQANATVAELEAYQRSQALVLVQDMADRIAANKLNADAYKRIDIGLTVIPTCAGLLGADLDLCEWNNKLVGAAEVTAGGGRVGAMIGARGCITEPTPNYYMVTIAWQGLSVAGAPASPCGLDAYGAGALDGQRRTVSMVVRVGLLGAT